MNTQSQTASSKEDIEILLNRVYEKNGKASQTRTKTLW